MKPEITVIMSVYNGDKFLSQAIESVLSQTHEDFFFIIIDDGSTDDTYSIIQHYMSKDDRIAYYYHSNLGLTKSLNVALSLCKTRYVARMDADDISHRERLATQLSFLKCNPEYGMVGSCVNIINEQGELIKRNRVVISHDEIVKRFGYANCFAHGSVMFDLGRLTSENIYYNEEFPFAQDFDLWTRIAKTTKVHNIRKPLYDLRIHRDSISANKLISQTSIASLIAYNFATNQSYTAISPNIENDHRFKIIAFINFFIKKSPVCWRYFNIKCVFLYVKVIFLCFIK